MKKLIFRILPLILILSLLGLRLPVYAAGDSTDASDEPEMTEEIPIITEEELRLWDRFGSQAEITFDENGEPALINGYPFRTVRAGFNSIGDQNSFEYTTDFMDYPFYQPSTSYDGNLAVMSLTMALSANRAVGFEHVAAEDFDPSLNLEHFLSDAGFSDIRKDDYSKVPSMYTVSTAMGQRVMEAESEEPFTLIAVGVCGGKYRSEWESNMSPGDGEIHEGFDSAATLVIDRISGYIATRGIKGRIKIWISGFSRAAAVSNLVAGELVQNGMFPITDVYAYTFATPAAVKNPPESGFENIFNIVGPMDLVPQVMPADWGYGRYGTTLYLPTQEFSSILGSLVAMEREETNRTVYGVENAYSAELNLRLRLFFSLVLNLVGTKENYNENYQPALVGIMQEKTVQNSLVTLRKLMLQIRSDKENRSDLDDVLVYLSRVIKSLASRSGLSAADRNTGNAFLRIITEHTENAYLANAYTIREGQFESNTVFYYVMVKGPVSITLSDPEAGLDLLTLGQDGHKSVNESWISIGDMLDFFYMERIGSVSVIAVPMDMNYQVRWTAEGNGSVECLNALCSVNASAVYPGMISDPVNVSAGDQGTAFLAENLQPVLPEGFSESTFEGWDLAVFLEIASPKFTWRFMLSFACALAALVLCGSACLLLSHRSGRQKKYRPLFWIFVCVFGIAVLETELAYWFFADQPAVRIVWKAAASCALIACYFLIHRPVKNVRSLSGSLFPALFLALAADLLLPEHFGIGAFLYLLSRTVMINFCFMRNRMSRGKWIQWAVISLPVSLVLIIFFVSSHGILGWAAAVYAPILLLLRLSSVEEPVRLRFSVLLVIVSDLLLMVFYLFVEDPVLHAGCMFLFYLSLLLITVDCSPGKAAAEASKEAENAAA